MDTPEQETQAEAELSETEILWNWFAQNHQQVARLEGFSSISGNINEPEIRIEVTTKRARERVLRILSQKETFLPESIQEKVQVIQVKNPRLKGLLRHFDPE